MGVSELGAPAETVAVNVTACPETDGFADDVSVVVVFALLTVWATPAEVLSLNSSLALYVAVIVLGPATCDVRVQLPAATVPMQKSMPSLTLTWPDGVPVPGLLTATS